MGRLQMFGVEQWPEFDDFAERAIEEIEADSPPFSQVEVLVKPHDHGVFLARIYVWSRGANLAVLEIGTTPYTALEAAQRAIAKKLESQIEEVTGEWVSLI